jgi:Ca-activated chloride channel family protein
MTTILKSINITGEICDAGGSIQVEHVYYNHQTLPIEVQYNFCLNTDTTVDSLKVTIGEREIVGQVQEKSQAQKTYTEAISENKRASILTKNGEQYTMTFGNIQPKETIIATHTYIAKLGSNNGKYLFVHPTNVGERYGMESINYHHKNQVMHHIPMNLDNPTHTVYVRIVCKSKSGVKNVTSPTNEITFERLNENEVVVTAMTLPKVGDFSLLIETNNTSSVYESTIDNKKYFMVTHKIDDEEVEYTPKEYIFLLDRSGSMDGQKIKDAVKAIIFAINLIKSDSYFNIMSFGDSYKLLFSKSVIANSESKTKAKHVLSTYSADMGVQKYITALLHVL